MSGLGKWRVIASAIVTLGVWWYVDLVDRSANAPAFRNPGAAPILGLLFGLVTYAALSGLLWLITRMRARA